MPKLGFLEFAAKELVRPGMKPFTIGLAANFVMFAMIPTSGAFHTVPLSTPFSRRVPPPSPTPSSPPNPLSDRTTGAKEASKIQNPHFHPGGGH